MIQEASFLREDTARQERWAHLTEGLSDYDRKVCEQLMDNAKALVEGNLQEASLDEATTTKDIATFNRVAYPLIRRIYPSLVSNRLVSIQPAALPAILVFYLDFVRGTNMAPTKRGDRTDYEGGSINKFYSSGVIRGEVVGEGDGTATTFQLDWYPIKPGSETIYVAGVVEGNYTIDEETGTIEFGTAPAAGATITADYALDLEGLGSEGSAQIPEVELRMTSSQVGLESKKLKAKWTVELQQDLAAYHGLSAESELVRHMGDEIRREIDRMIIDDLYTHASAGNVNWSKTIPSGTTAKAHYETLVHAFADASNEIYKKRFRHANFVVMAPDTLAMLDKTNAFRITGAGQDGSITAAQISAGPNVFGTISSRFDVIVDPLFPTDKVLLGYKGDSWIETGYVFAPYVAFQTQTFIDPNTMMPVKGLMSRFGRHLVNGDFYATVTITA